MQKVCQSAVCVQACSARAHEETHKIHAGKQKRLSASVMCYAPAAVVIVACKCRRCHLRTFAACFPHHQDETHISIYLAAAARGTYAPPLCPYFCVLTHRNTYPPYMLPPSEHTPACTLLLIATATNACPGTKYACTSVAYLYVRACSSSSGSRMPPIIQRHLGRRSCTKCRKAPRPHGQWPPYHTTSSAAEAACVRCCDEPTAAS